MTPPRVLSVKWHFFLVFALIDVNLQWAYSGASVEILLQSAKDVRERRGGISAIFPKLAGLHAPARPRKHSNRALLAEYCDTFRGRRNGSINSDLPQDDNSAAGQSRC
jgi:hypothetical protein